MTAIQAIKAELENLKAAFTAFIASKKDEPQGEPQGENQELTAALSKLTELEATVGAIDLEAIKAEAKADAKAEIESEVKAELEKTFEDRVAAAAAEKLAAAGAAPLATGPATKDDKQSLSAKGLKGRALTVAALKQEKGETL